MSRPGLTADVLIAGTGPAGATFARYLAAAGYRVVMADPGPQLGRRAGESIRNPLTHQMNPDNLALLTAGLLQPLSMASRRSGRGSPTGSGWPRKIEPGFLNPRQNPRRNLPGAAAVHAVGGMLIHWTGALPRQHPVMERSPIVPADEWGSLYAEAEALLGKHTTTYKGFWPHVLVREALRRSYGAGLQPPYHVQDLPIGVERLNKTGLLRYVGTDDILGELADPDRDHGTGFVIRQQHLVRKLVVRGGRVRHAVIENLLEGRSFELHAALYVVACGTVLTAQLLWNSGIRPAALGRYLTDHPLAFCQVLLPASRARKLASECAESMQEQASGSAARYVEPPPSIWIPVSEGRPWHSQVATFFRGSRRSDPISDVCADLRWFGMIDPAPENRVTFESEAATALGMPQPTFDFRLGPADRRRTTMMLADLKEAARSTGKILPAAEPRLLPLGIAQHLQGSCRMGARDDGTSVVDPCLRVWGFENLYVAGNSVIPTANACNPTLTSIALAIKACRSILRSQ